MGPDIHIPDATDAAKVMATMATTAPHWLALLLVVSAFLVYLERHDQAYARAAESGDIVAVQRIAQCHSVQERGWKAMDRLSETLERQLQTFGDLASVIDEHNRITHKNEAR